MKTILSIFPFDLQRQGGLEIQASAIIEGLAAAGNEMIVILPEQSAWQKKVNIKIYGLPFIRLKIDPWSGLYFLWKNRCRIKRIIHNKDVDIVHIHGNDITAGYAFLFKKWFGTKVLLTSHGMMSDNKEYIKWKPNLKEPIRQFGRVLPIRLLEWLDVKSADKITVVSKSLTSIRNDATHIPNSFNPALFNPHVLPIPAFKRKKALVMCSGRISPEKGQSVLIKAIPQIIKAAPDTEFVFIGNDYLHSIYDELVPLASNLGVTKNILFIPQRPLEDIPAIYKSADVIVVPSLSEAFGLVVLENLALGNAVIASNVGGIPELIKDGVNGILVPPNNPEELAKAIVQVLTDNYLRQWIKQNAPESVKKYSVKNIIPRYDELIKGLITK